VIHIDAFITIVSLPTIAFIGFLIYGLAVGPKIASRKKCEHGVVGGLNNKACDICNVRAEEARKREYRVYEAGMIREQEVKRLKHLYVADVDRLRELTPTQFEDEVAHIFRLLGYEVRQTPYSNDGGKDAIAFKDGQKYLIECKKYSLDHSIGRPILQKFYAAIIEEKARRGYLVTTGKFASTAYEYAEKSKIELVGPLKLADMVKEAYPGGASMNVEALCVECGERVNFKVGHEPSVKNCKNGHPVQNDITLSFVRSSWVPKQSHQNRRPQSRRRRY
jgi:hypothetical protein